MSISLEKQIKVNRNGCFTRDFQGERELERKLKSRGVICLDLDDIEEKEGNELKENTSFDPNLPKQEKAEKKKSPYFQDILKEAVKFIANRSHQIREYFNFSNKSANNNNNNNARKDSDSSQQVGSSSVEGKNNQQQQSNDQIQEEKNKKNEELSERQFGSQQSIQSILCSDSMSISNRVQLFIQEEQQFLLEKSIQRTKSLNQSFRSIKSLQKKQKNASLSNISMKMGTGLYTRSKTSIPLHHQLKIKNNLRHSVLDSQNLKRIKSSEEENKFKLPLQKQNSIRFNIINEALNSSNDQIVKSVLDSPRNTHKNQEIQKQAQQFALSKVAEKAKFKVQLRQVLEMKEIAKKAKEDEKIHLKRNSNKYVPQLSKSQLHEAKKKQESKKDFSLLQDPDILLSRESSFLVFSDKVQTKGSILNKHSNEESNTRQILNQRDNIEERQSEWSQSCSSSSSSSDLGGAGEEGAEEKNKQLLKVNASQEDNEQSASSFIGVQNHFEENDSCFSSANVMPIVIGQNGISFKKPYEKVQLEVVPEIERQHSSELIEDKEKNDSNHQKSTKIQNNEEQKSIDIINHSQDLPPQKDQKDLAEKQLLFGASSGTGLFSNLFKVTKDKKQTNQEINNKQDTIKEIPFVSQEPKQANCEITTTKSIFETQVKPQKDEGNLFTASSKTNGLFSTSEKSQDPLSTSTKEGSIFSSVIQPKTIEKPQVTEVINQPNPNLTTTVQPIEKSPPKSLFQHLQTFSNSQLFLKENDTSKDANKQANQQVISNSGNLFEKKEIKAATLLTPEKKSSGFIVEEQKNTEMAQELPSSSQIFNQASSNITNQAFTNNKPSSSSSNNNICSTPQSTNIFGVDQVNPFGQRSSPFGGNSNQQVSVNKGFSLNDLVSNSSDSFKFNQISVQSEPSSLFKPNLQNSLFQQSQPFTQQNNFFQPFSSNSSSNFNSNVNNSSNFTSQIAPFPSDQNNQNTPFGLMQNQINSNYTQQTTIYPSSVSIFPNTNNTPIVPMNYGFQQSVNPQNEFSINSQMLSQAPSYMNNFQAQTNSMQSNNLLNPSLNNNSFSTTMFGNISQTPQMGINSLFSSSNTPTPQSTSNYAQKKGKAQKTRI